MKKPVLITCVIALAFLLLPSQQLSAQFKYKLSEYNSRIRASQSFDKSIRVNEISLDTTWFFHYHLTNTKVFAAVGAWTAITEENIRTLSSIIRSNVRDSELFSLEAEADSDTDYELNTYLMFWNSSLSASLVYTGLSAIVELVDQDGRVIWNQNYYYEHEAVAMKRKVVVRKFIDQLMTDLISLELDEPGHMQVNIDPDEETGALVVYYSGIQRNVKRAKSLLNKTEKFADLPPLPGKDYICDYMVFHFRGPRLYAIDCTFDTDHKTRTLEDQVYRILYLNEENDITMIVDSTLNSRTVLSAEGQKDEYNELIEDMIALYVQEDSILLEEEKKAQESGSQEELKNLQEQRALTGQIITGYQEKGVLTEELIDLIREQWHLNFEEHMVIYEFSQQKAFKYFRQ